MLLALLIPTVALAERPNILIIMAEDLSPRIGAFGDKVAVTPNIDALAQQGVRYTNVFTTAGVCSPSRAGHILGQHQISTGTQHMRSSGGPNGGYVSVPPEHVKAYPELLRKAGYYTFNANKTDYQFTPTFGNDGVNDAIWDVNKNGATWRDLPRDKPFFGMITLAVTHESGMFDPLGTWPQSIQHFVMQLVRYFSSSFGGDLPELTEQEKTNPKDIVLEPYYPDTPLVRRDIARHYDNIQIMDKQVGQILEQLEQDGLADNTIVLWTTDHGDGLPRAKRELFDSGLKAPMVIRWHNNMPAKAGSTDDRLISYLDFAPTFLNIAKTELPKWLHGQDFTSSNREYIYASRDRIDAIPDRQRAVRSKQYKYIKSWQPQQPGGHPLEFRDNLAIMRELTTLHKQGKLNDVQSQWLKPPGEERLFDVLADPYELNNLAAGESSQLVLAQMQTALSEWLEKVEDYSDMPELKQAEMFAPNGERLVTPLPLIKRVGSAIEITAQLNASIVYRVNDAERWSLYSRPLVLGDGDNLEAKAVRYGWLESDRINF